MQTNKLQEHLIQITEVSENWNQLINQLEKKDLAKKDLAKKDLVKL